MAHCSTVLTASSIRGLALATGVLCTPRVIGYFHPRRHEYSSSPTSLFHDIVTVDAGRTERQLTSTGTLPNVLIRLLPHMGAKWQPLLPNSHHLDPRCMSTLCKIEDKHSKPGLMLHGRSCQWLFSYSSKKLAEISQDIEGHRASNTRTRLIPVSVASLQRRTSSDQCPSLSDIDQG